MGLFHLCILSSTPTLGMWISSPSSQKGHIRDFSRRRQLYQLMRNVDFLCFEEGVLIPKEKGAWVASLEGTLNLSPMASRTLSSPFSYPPSLGHKITNMPRIDDSCITPPSSGGLLIPRIGRAISSVSRQKASFEQDECDRVSRRTLH